MKGHKTTTINRNIYLLIILIAGMTSCNKGSHSVPIPPIDTPVTLTPYTIIYPLYFPLPVIPDDNKPYVERIQLGRMLYYDTSLSNDGRACGNCHMQSYGFSRPDLYNNAMPVLPHENLAWNTFFMWDGSKTGKLEDIMLFETQVFFATDLNKMNQNSQYKSLFKKYFGVAAITYKEISYALAQYIRTLVTRDSKFDRVMRGTAQFTFDEDQGWRIFFSEKGDCFHCHPNLTFTDNLFHNTGIDSPYTSSVQMGYFNVSGDSSDIGKFRSPNLRNVALRSYYMHDGRFTSLDQVIDFYDHGMHKVSNLDPIMTKPQKINGLHLSSTDKSQLINFLQTLTDSTFISDTTLCRPKS